MDESFLHRVQDRLFTSFRMTRCGWVSLSGQSRAYLSRRIEAEEGNAVQACLDERPIPEAALGDEVGKARRSRGSGGGATNPRQHSRLLALLAARKVLSTREVWLIASSLRLRQRATAFAELAGFAAKEIFFLMDATSRPPRRGSRGGCRLAFACG
jgi:hypothetical protein